MRDVSVVNLMFTDIGAFLFPVLRALNDDVRVTTFSERMVGKLARACRLLKKLIEVSKAESLLRLSIELYHRLGYSRMVHGTSRSVILPPKCRH